MLALSVHSERHGIFEKSVALETLKAFGIPMFLRVSLPFQRFAWHFVSLYLFDNTLNKGNPRSTVLKNETLPEVQVETHT